MTEQDKQTKCLKNIASEAAESIKESKYQIDNHISTCLGMFELDPSFATSHYCYF